LQPPTSARTWRSRRRLWKIWADKGNAEARTLLAPCTGAARACPATTRKRPALPAGGKPGLCRAQNDIGLSCWVSKARHPHDDVEAYKWLTLAIDVTPARNQDRLDQAKKDRATWAARMTPAQLTEAERRAKAWKPGP